MIDTGAGVIDADYRGPLFLRSEWWAETDATRGGQGRSTCSSSTTVTKTLMVRHSDQSLCNGFAADARLGTVAVHDRVAQLILERIVTPEITEVAVCSFLASKLKRAGS